jgi:hypothetical protein
MFRDFIYLDIDRVQSILAQLQQGLLTEMMDGHTKAASGKLSTTEGILAQFLPISGSAEGSLSKELRQSKILHDYALAVAMQSLENGRLLVDATELEWSELSVLNEVFVLVRGTARIVDYETLQMMATNESAMNRLFGRRRQDGGETDPPQNRQQWRHQERQGQRLIQQSDESNLGQMGEFISMFRGDAVQIAMVNSQETKFIGLLSRAHLREDIRSLIFKYGSEPQGTWTMLSHITRIPEPGWSLQDMGKWNELFGEGGSGEFASVNDMFEFLLSKLNVLQEFVGSVTYPSIAVSPVAVYREVFPIDEVR